MNVAYRGVENKLHISRSGIPNHSITASGEGLRKDVGIGNYILTPSKNEEVNINVIAKLDNGQTVTSKSTLQIKDIPMPAASFRGSEWGSVKKSKSFLKVATVSVILPDCKLDLKINLSGFTIKFIFLALAYCIIFSS